MRFFSTIWILFGAITSYIILYKHHYKLLALLYTLFFLLAPNTIYYAQECRNYAMILALTSIFCSLLYLVFESMHKRVELVCLKWYFSGILLCGVGLVLTHYYAYVFVFCVGVVFLVQSILSKKYFKPLFVCFGLMGLVGVAWIGLHHYLGGFLYRMDSSWVWTNSLWVLFFKVLLYCFGYKTPWVIIIITLLLAFRFTGFAPYRQYAPFLYIVGLELIIISLIFLNLSQTMAERFFMELYCPIYLFVASVLLYSQRFLKYLKFAMPLFMIVLVTYRSPLLGHAYNKQDFRAASAYIAAHFDPTQCKLPVSWIAFKRYLPQFEAIAQPLWQENCDLILLSAGGEEKVVRPLLEKHHITHYKIIEFKNNVQVVVKEDFTN